MSEQMNIKIKMSFDPQIAKDVGVEEAIMYSNIEFWVEHNSVNEQHFYDGYYWTYNSVVAFVKLFPFWTEKQIFRIIKNLEDGGYIKSGHYNISKYNRTKWYTCTYQVSSFDSPKQANGENQVGESLAYSKPYNKLKTITKVIGEATETQKQPTIYGNPDINWLIQEFETIIGFKSQGGGKDRLMAKHLLNNYSKEQLTVMLQWCSSDPYAPRVGSVEKLWYKRGDILAGLKKKIDNPSIVVINE